MDLRKNIVRSKKMGWIQLLVIKLFLINPTFFLVQIYHGFSVLSGRPKTKIQRTAIYLRQYFLEKHTINVITTVAFLT